jgi:hypothetical protein
MVQRQYLKRETAQLRMILLLGLALAAVGLALFLGASFFYDGCTGSFERSAEAVVNSYLGAVQSRDLSRVERCWVKSAYTDLQSGCSATCLAQAAGGQYQVKNIDMGELSAAVGSRSNMSAVVTVTCQNGKELTGKIVLDTSAATLPWRHWRVQQSTIGGTAAQAWCK